MRLISILVLFFGFQFFFSNFAFGAGLVPCVGDAECTVCDLQKLAGNIINTLIILGTMVATLLFVYAGILYVFSPANPGNIGKAHKIFLSTLWGFVTILSSWLIVNLIMSTLFNSDDFGNWNSVLCNKPSSFSQNENVAGLNTTPSSQGTNTSGTSQTTSQTTGSTSSGGKVLTDQEARSKLSGNITTWESAPGKTSFEGIQQTTIEGVNALSLASKVPRGEFVITGAVDKGGPHAEGTYSHENGYKVDVDDRYAISQYIQNNFKESGTTSEGWKKYTTTINGMNVTAVRETTHWDISFIPK